jgi:hypothetical protein
LSGNFTGLSKAHIQFQWDGPSQAARDSAMICLEMHIATLHNALK